MDPIGSASRFDALLLVEWPLPWPSDIGEVEELAAAARDQRATVMAVVPEAGTTGGPDGRLRVVHHRRVGTHRFAGVDHAAERTDVPALLDALLQRAGEDTADLPSAVGPAGVDVLVCAHGRRDPCCGRFGTTLQAELAERRPDARVWRCSHTGGHRYAPTAVTVADGRFWAYLDADLVAGILDRSVDVAALDGHARGTTALDPWGQAVEHRLLAEHGWAWLDGSITEATTELADDGRSARVAIAWTAADGTAGRAEAEVGVRRVLPVLVCGEPPEQARKSSPEYEVRTLVTR